jgi:hypothetical protein
MLQTVIIGIAVGFIAILLMGIRVFFTKKGEFPNTHIGASKAIQERGINCATSQDTEYRYKESPILKLMKNEKL